MDLQQLIADLFSADIRVRYVALFSRDGTKLQGGMRSGTKSLEPERDAEEIDRQTTLYCSKVMGEEEYLGKTGFIFVRTERADVLALPLDSNLILQVASEPLLGFELLDLVHRMVGA